MKNIYLIILLFIGVSASAQSPDKMSYQAVLRDANGVILKNQNVSIQFSVLQTSISGTSVYQEDHKLTTNSNGLVSVHIGTGTVSSGDFSIIDWSEGPYFLQSEIDPTGGSNYTISSTTEFISVPYAMYASKAGFADSLIGDSNFVDLTTNQTVDGEKTFNNDLTVNGITVGTASGSDSTSTAIGFEALRYNTGFSNTAIGAETLWNNTTGGSNTAIGTFALNSNTTGGGNIGIGLSSLLNNKTGNNNIGIGSYALYSNTLGSLNTAIGYAALSNSTIGWNNTANGYGALYNNNEGYNNTANGYEALANNNDGWNNTANGYRALYSAHLDSFSGWNNTANGYRALYSNAIGRYNTANGSNALFSNTSGDNNTANGSNALFSNTSGDYNTANGLNALYSNTIGGYNTANGLSALYSNTIGSFNTGIGYGANVTLSNISNATAIGSGARVSASNRVRIGNTSVTRIEGQVAWSNTSDGRIKENVQEAVPGLSFISELRPVTYTLNTRKQDEITMQAMPDSIKEKHMLSDEEYLKSSSIVRTGFIAQEVEAAAQKVGFDFDGVSAPENETDLYGIRYAEFVVPLVRAMQEQQEIIEQLIERIEVLEKK